ncbi:MAG: Hsp70 family protein [Candidatus Shapirobacteria bacterium]
MSPTHCGIDFGTTNSSLSICQNEKPVVIPIDRLNPNNKVLKSLVYLNPKQEIAIGHNAINNYLNDLKNFPSVPLRIESTGRMIKVMVPTGSGPMKADWVPEIVEVDDSGRGRLLQSLKSVLTSSTFTGTNIFGKFYSLEDLLTLLLKQIKSNAETEIGHPLTHAVIGRPVKYVGTSENKIALDRMQTIAKNAGFEQVEFEYEPVGAALDYGINSTSSQKILVYDFGGGTLDICIMELPSKKILSVSGRGLGGDMLDSHLALSKIAPHFGLNSVINGKMPFPRYLFSTFQSWYLATLQKTVKNHDTLEELAVKSNQPELVKNLISLIFNDYGFEFFQTLDSTKIDLSTKTITDFLFKRQSLYVHEQITKLDFETAIGPDLQTSQECIDEALNLANLKPSQIDNIILTGGSSQVPIFISQIKNIFGADKIITSNHFTSVASGLAVRAEQLFQS